jgi:ABC-type dipeptide/oligopeptide/nickel transport system permease component
MVTETQYGKWFMLLLRARGGQTLAGEPVWTLVSGRLAVSSALLACLLALGLALVGTLRTSSVRPTLHALESAVPVLIAELPLLLSLAVAIELGFGVRGLFASASAALASGDVNTWMAVCLAIALVTSVGVGLVDSVLSPSWAKAEGGAAP